MPNLCLIVSSKRTRPFVTAMGAHHLCLQYGSPSSFESREVTLAFYGNFVRELLYSALFFTHELTLSKHKELMMMGYTSKITGM